MGWAGGGGEGTLCPVLVSFTRSGHDSGSEVVSFYLSGCAAILSPGDT